MTVQDKGIAVVGSGYWSKNLIRNYHQIGVLKVISDHDETVLSEFAGQYSDVETGMTFSDLLLRGDIVGIVIATPAETHYNLVREALLANKHVYVEKPLTLDSNHAEELIAIAEERNRTLMVGHPLQYHPAFEYLKSLILAGELGRINYIYSNRLNIEKIHHEENILCSFVPHDISMILSIVGEMPETVQTAGGAYLHRKIADVTTIHMTFPSGLQAHVFVSWLHPFKEQKLVVVGDRKMVVFDDTLPWQEKLRGYRYAIEWQNNIPIPVKTEAEHFEIDTAEPLRRECEHFLDCIQTRTTPRVDGREGLKVLNVLKASQRSVEENGKVIRLDGILGEPEMPSDAPATPVNDLSESPPPFIHGSAVVDAGCEIGRGTKIWHFSHLLANTRIGEGCNIGQNVTVGPEVTIGRYCKIQNNVSVYKGVTLEDGVFCGPSMVFTNIINPRAEIAKMHQMRLTRVKRGATLGANCTIVCGHTIGRFALVGAGAVVTADVADHALVVGNPAHRIGWVCRCGERLDEKLVCPICGKCYEAGPQGLVDIR